jgi:redox-sensitive bicupin YhaK (pirin superfamily)
VSESTTVEVTEGSRTRVGSLPVRRALPTRGRRTVGPWCFVDQMGPTTFAAGSGVSVPPHPHLGLQTVTWLFDGAALHRDSLGSEQPIRPGELNLMTAGAGIAHSEEDPGGPDHRIHGMQLWVAQPEATRWGAPAFEHHVDLPRVEVDGGSATVLVGGFAGASSPARRDTDHVGVELRLRPGTSVVPLDPAYEHAVVMADGTGSVRGVPLRPGSLTYVAPGADELVTTSESGTLAVLVGGVPFAEEVVMWWNFVARTRDELSDAYRSWAGGDGRFGTVTSTLDRAGVGPPPWLRGD